MNDTRHPTIKAFIIHLASASDRQPQVTLLIESLPVEVDVIDAIDGRTLDPQTIARVYRRKLHRPNYPFALGTNEIACFLSHRKAWQAIVDQKLDAGFIIEDDVELTAEFDAAFKTACKIMTPDSFIRFPFRERETGRQILNENGVRVIAPVPVGLGMVAQLVGREAAKRLLERTQTFDRPVDTMTQMNWITGLRPLSVLPGGVREISAQLGGTTIQHKKAFSDKLQREIMRPFYRMQVRRFSAKP